jgi:large subunit ribosomal protein L1
MAKLSKRTRAFREKVEPGKYYPIDDAVSLLAELSTVKFKESIDVSINLGVDPKKSDQVVRGATVLPNGTGKDVRVAVFAQGEKADEAKEAGADVIGMDDLAASVKEGNLDFDVVIATPDSMRVVGQLGQVLGPRGLMPNPRLGTVTPDVGEAVRNAKAGQVRYRTDRNGIIHGGVGQVGFEPAQIKENIEALLADLRKAKPASAKGTYLKKIVLSTTMGAGILIDQSSLEES